MILRQQVKCPRCGEQVDSRGLSRHQSGQACAATLFARKMKKRGWVRAGTGANRISRLGGPIQEGPTFVHDGYENKRGQKRGARRKVKRKLWTPGWMLDVLLHNSDEAIREALAEPDPAEACRDLTAFARLRGGPEEPLRLAG